MADVPLPHNAMKRILDDAQLIAVRMAARAKDTRPWADTLAFGQAVEKAVLDQINALPQAFEPSAYQVEFKIRQFTQFISIEKCRQQDGTALWAIRHMGNCYGDGDWEHEPMPSSRSDEFLSKYRYPSLEAAAGQIDAAVDAAKQLYL